MPCGTHPSHHRGPQVFPLHRALPASTLQGRHGSRYAPRAQSLFKRSQGWTQHSMPHHPGQRDTCTSRLGKSAHAKDACEHGLLPLTGHDHASTSQRPGKGTIKGGCRASMQHLEASKGSHGGSLSDSHAIISKEILRDLMADLAQGLADIARLRQEAMSARAPLAPCKTPPTLEIQYEGLPAPSHRTPDNDLPQQCSSQEAGVRKPPQLPLQQHHARAQQQGWSLQARPAEAWQGPDMAVSHSLEA